MEKPIFLISISVVILFNLGCEEKETHIPYSEYIDCLISMDTTLLSKESASELTVNVINHTEVDLAMDYLYVELQLSDNKDFYGSPIYEFKSGNGKYFDLLSNDTLKLKSNLKDVIWNSSYPFDSIKSGIYSINAVVVTGDLNAADNQIFSNQLSIEKR